MSSHPVNLALRFLLEIAGLVAFGILGWNLGGGGLRYLWAILIPVAAAFAWGAFRVPGDGGPPLVRVPGILRLALEAVFFGGAVWGLFAAGQPGAGWVFGIIVALHYIVSYDRLIWIVRQ